MTKFKLFFLLINLILVVSFTAPSPLYAQAPPGQEYTLKSSDGQIEVYFDQKYGGAITKIFDHPNSGSQNLVDNSQAGAMFQIAFWQIPNHITVPPDCDPNMTDKWNDNPTQAGFQGDGHIGNPIGILGTNTSLPDPKEFIRYENSNQTIHFKSRFIRYDYCQTGIGAPTSNSACDAKAKTYYNNPQATCRDLWDTGFYLEQTAYFHPQLPHVLVTHNQLTQEDSHYNTTMITRSLPILFANNLPRLLYWKDGAKYLNTTGGAFLPDDDWGALVGLTNESGIGFVGSRHMTSNLPWEPLYSWGVYGTSMATVQIGSHVSLETMGQLQNVDKQTDANGQYYYVYNFSPTGNNYTWNRYFPIGDLITIKTASEGLIANPSLTFNPKISGYVDNLSCTLTQGWAKDDAHYTTPIEVHADTYPVGEYSNLSTKSTIANTYRSDLVNVCDQGKCVFSLNLGPFPATFSGKKLVTKIWGKNSSGEMVIFNSKNNQIGPCSNLETPTPKVGDLNHNQFVDFVDYLIARLNYNLSVSLFNFNQLIRQYGS